MSISITDMCNIMERRIDRLVNPKLNDLPPFLTNGKEGLNSGYMIWQYTAAALASENKTLAHPASADTITTSGFQEDHVSMGAWGTRKLWKILMNFVQILSIEAVVAHRAMEFVKPKKSGEKIEELYCQMSDLLPPHKKDRYFGDEFRSVTEFLFEKAGLEKLDYEN
jgi:histidine ammonia-lyase